VGTVYTKGCALEINIALLKTQKISSARIESTSRFILGKEPSILGGNAEQQVDTGLVEQWPVSFVL